ncbi:MAG: 6-pyruvoyl-tetrahydropterin synthase-related protein [Candidatus Shapirobacteria bacterium]|nr:6-pyruvoyl-tetrahydropterin synthase-related protein [Candidatus Shapirobacteria bacterium]MDD3002464.1 6-pyruvoyl-tetrahydropterin synthase-related protein [Candidatus Shapirobacteria bacterium]MDD4383347.1 6-pyruvoyl-tetrahydropterin synthase-related protein [Candidatus Shapirobacteria bacterium]
MKFKKNIILLICLFLISIFTFYRLLQPGYFSMMDDMHVFRLDQFDKCLKDGQIPCRFIQDGGMGYGYPLFNYYSPLAYGVAEVFHLTGFSFINSLKITFALCHVIGIFGMYFFASLFWGNLGGFVSAIIFLLAPYQATDSFVRGAIAESLAINIIPWVFYFLTKFINSNKNKFFLIFSLTALLLSHNLTSLAIAPVLVIFSFFLLFKNKKLNFKSILNLTIPVLFSLGLSSFFVLPALLEKNLVTVDTMTQGYFQYIIHFATLDQLFISRFWGFGASLWGPVDDMAFSIGLIQWLLPLISIIFLFFKKNKKNLSFPLLFFFIFLFFVFLTHNKSTFIWKLFPFMSFYQFPWRFLSIAIFAASFIAGSIILLINNKKLQILTVVIISITTILLNFSYFKEDIWYSNLTDNQELSSDRILAQSAAGLKDYWPKYSQNFPTAFAPNQPIVSQGVVINYYVKKSNRVILTAIANSNAQITLPLVYFPNWQLYIDRQKSDFQIDQDLGLIKFNLTSGNHSIVLKLKNTPIRNIANLISLISFISIIVTGIKLKRKNEK